MVQEVIRTKKERKRKRKRENTLTKSPNSCSQHPHTTKKTQREQRRERGEKHLSLNEKRETKQKEKSNRGSFTKKTQERTKETVSLPFLFFICQSQAKPSAKKGNSTQAHHCPSHSSKNKKKKTNEGHTPHRDKE